MRPLRHGREFTFAPLQKQSGVEPPHSKKTRTSYSLALPALTKEGSRTYEPVEFYFSFAPAIPAFHAQSSRALPSFVRVSRMGHPPGRSIFHSRHLLLFLQQRFIIFSIG